MSNMSYCRFRNTLEDLKDCYENLDDTDVVVVEDEAREELINLCKQIAKEFED